MKGTGPIFLAAACPAGQLIPDQQAALLQRSVHGTGATKGYGAPGGATMTVFPAPQMNGKTR
jgi:hypothetical protein